MHSIHIIADYILNKYENEITPMKLQKLLYYIKVWSIVAQKKVISPNDSFFAWKHGPVNPAIYHKYKSFKNNPIQSHSGFTPPIAPLDSDEIELVDFILDSYAFYNAVTLSKATHAEDPWINKKDSSGRITEIEVLEYYRNEAFAKNFPLNSNQNYYPPNLISHFAYIFDMGKHDKATEIVFDSIEEYKSLFIDTQKQSQEFAGKIF